MVQFGEEASGSASAQSFQMDGKHTRAHTSIYALPTEEGGLRFFQFQEQNILRGESSQMKDDLEQGADADDNSY